jgi:hypothetical protein
MHFFFIIKKAFTLEMHIYTMVIILNFWPNWLTTLKQLLDYYDYDILMSKYPKI